MGTLLLNRPPHRQIEPWHRALGLSIFLAQLLIGPALSQTVTLSYTGSTQTYTVPAGAGSVSIQAAGAGGGGGGADLDGAGASGGHGATVSGVYLAQPGTVLNIYVGGGGIQGYTSSFGHSCTNSAGAGGGSGGSAGLAGGAGGQAGCSGYSGGGGGGGAATVIATSANAIVLVAGGGGGGQGGSWSSTAATSQNSTSQGTLPGTAGGVGIAPGSNDGGGGGGGGAGCPGGAGGSIHGDQTGTANGTAAGAGLSCANTAVFSGFTILASSGGLGGVGDPASNGSSDPDGGTAGGAGSVVLTAVTGPNHYAVAGPSTAVNCAPAGVTISAHTSTHALITTINTIAINTSTGHGDWTLTTGAGTFVAGASNSGAATYTYAASDAGAAVFALRDTYAETVTVTVSDGSASAKSGTALASEDSPIAFAASGFITTNGSNVATGIATQLAGVRSTMSLALQAVRTDTKSGACTSVFASGSTVNISLGFQCNNPVSCVAGQALMVTNNGTTTSIASNPNSAVSNYTTVPLKFSTVNAEAPLALTYSDAGQISLVAKYNIPLASGAASGNMMVGSGQFVTQPYTLTLSNIKRASDGFANPAAATAAGTMFIGAGQAFLATVTAQNYQGNSTPNFGLELSPATVTLTPALVLPTSGDDPSISGSFNSFLGGSATGTAFGWPEVGIITLTPQVANYLGSGAVSGTTSGDVGRFVPSRFAVSLNTPLFGTACAAGGFTYLGQAFAYSIAPVMTATAQALGGTTTQNYTGALMRMTNASLTGRSYTPTPTSPGLNLSGLPAIGIDPAIADLGGGKVTLTFSSGSGISVTRGAPIAPFSANIALSINVIDLDGASATNPVTFGSGSGIGFTTSAAQFYGRLALRDSVGSELLDLPMSLTAQYYLGASLGFTPNTNDSCTASPTIAFSNYQLNLAAGKTCVRDSGNPGISGAGCATAATSRYLSAASAGGFNLILAAPGAGNPGAATVTAGAPSWLLYIWNSGSGINSNPSGMATFGVFPGAASRIYQREVY